MSTETSSDASEERSFPYAPQPRGLAVFCCLFTMAVFAAFWFPAIRRSGLPDTTVLVVLFAVFFVYVFVVYFFLPEGRRRAVTVGEAGITVGRCFASWERVEKIDRRRGPFRELVVLLKRGKRRWYDFLLPRRVLTLPPYDLIYRDVLPAILEKRPGLPVSERVRAGINDVATAVRPMRWLLLVLGGVDLLLFGWLLWVSPLGILPNYIVGFLLLVLNLGVPRWCLFTVRDSRESFLKIAFLCVGILGCSVGAAFLVPFEHYELQTVGLLAVALSTSAVVVLLFVRRLTAPLQVVLAILLAAVPVPAYLCCRAQVWPTEDVTDLLTDETICFTVWGRSGKYLGVAYAEGMDRVLDVPGRSATRLPRHDGVNALRWLDERLLIREIRPRDKWELLIYDFGRGEEFAVPARGESRVGVRQPLSFDRRRLVWIEPRDDQMPDRLRIWNIETRRDEYPPIALADMKADWEPYDAFWLDDDTVLVKGTAPREGKRYCTEKSLTVLRVRPGTKPSRLFISSRRSRYWRLSADCRYALAIDERSHDDCSLALVDLTSDNVTELKAGGSYPVLTPSVEGFYRTTEIGGRLTLTRVDFADGSESPLYAVPEGMKLSEVSRSGRFALFIADDFLSGGAATLVHVPDGKEHRIHFYGLRRPTGALKGIAGLGGSVFSPDERHFVVEVLGAGGSRSLLYTIPEDWPGGAP